MGDTLPGGVPCWGVPCGGYPAGGTLWGIPYQGWVPCGVGTLWGYPARGVPCRENLGGYPGWGGTLTGGTLPGGYPVGGTLPGGYPVGGYPAGGYPVGGTLARGGPCQVPPSLLLAGGGGSYLCGVQAATELFCCELALYSLLPHGIMGNVAKHHGSQRKKIMGWVPPPWTN